MKQLNIQNSVFGPFQAITPQDDHWACDALVLPYAVVGRVGVIAAWQPPPPTVNPPEVPQSVTMRQARLALLAAGKLDAVAPAIAAMPSPAKEQAAIEWEYSTTVERQRPLVLALGPALGLNDAALDALFVQAATL